MSDPLVIDTSNAESLPDGTGSTWWWMQRHFNRWIYSSFYQCCRMFPFYENNSEWDDFTVINPDDYVIKDEDMNQGAALVGGDMDGKIDEASASLILDSRPSKVVSSELTVSTSEVFTDIYGL
ncbi:hypothetical protein RchiOBHm_Chr1g0379341 [Rosa chinensis]|uniref:Uncharacterized protein n=1 Tax=Rosa chinensis TaxID=74649 RepID=A0A2P6SNM6_ROSCH|nr:hypothetical protein RchiOBHm_Chr1g0379171 [Rosa chinensis]PRQ60268.1 hypothetical protein RchiOBHm_Chr1g0379341 [Rosa chinensis]